MRRPPLKYALPAAAALVVLIAAVVVATTGDDGGENGESGQSTGDQTAPDRGERGEDEGDESGEDAEDTEPAGDGTVAGAGGRRLTVGISDQKPAFFRDPRFQRLGIDHVRLVVPWDAGTDGHQATDRWLDAAEQAGRQPLVVFGHADGSQCPEDPCEAPSAGEFERAFEAFRERWPEVETFSTWNEPNHASQPVPDEPGLVARYWRAIRDNCDGCTVLGADVVADRSARGWVRGFLREADRRPRIWGVHNYSDTNRFTSENTEAFLDLVQGRVWITETGGIVKFTTASGRTTFPYDEERAARATRQMFEVARSDPRIERLYVYHWNQVNPPGRFDAGLIGPDGEARPAYDVLRDEIAR
ncbi:MAG: glycosyl hydrolase [Thermoleophilaceae bacterium]